LSKTQLFFLLLFAPLASAPLCHVEILWAEESLLAAEPDPRGQSAVRPHPVR
jgi:hypothetical protein